jgi:hypothetical protein
LRSLNFGIAASLKRRKTELKALEAEDSADSNDEESSEDEESFDEESFEDDEFDCESLSDKEEVKEASKIEIQVKNMRENFTNKQMLCDHCIFLLVFYSKTLSLINHTHCLE